MKNLEGKLIEFENNTYRIYHQDDFFYYLIDYFKSAITLRVVPVIQLDELIELGVCLFAENQHILFVEQKVLDNMMDNAKTRFETYKTFIREIENHVGPTFMEIVGKKTKKWFTELYQSMGISKCTAFRIINRYLKSSPKENGLLDSRFSSYSSNRQSRYNGCGRKTAKGESPHVINDDDIRNMEQAFEIYKGGQQRTIHNAYLWMLDRYYSYEVAIPAAINSSATTIRRPLQPGERVSERQFRTFLNDRKQELMEAKLGIRAFRNNNRRLFGRPSADVPYAGYLVEVDALDMDLNIVSDYNKDKAVSRPTLYAMRDVLTGMVLAVAVTLEKNSKMGISRLVMNLLEDKVELAASFGITLNPQFWPSGIIPSVWRTDHGSDFMSKDLEIALAKIGVRKETVPPATGSFKGKIESLFKVFYTELNPVFEGHGLVSRKYKGNDIEGACLTLTSLWEIVVRFVIWFNTHPYKTIERKLTPEMLKEPDATNTSAFLWKYSIEHYGSPRHFDDDSRRQTLFNLMEPVNASICRDGIHVLGLIYDEPSDDLELSAKILLATGKSSRKANDNIVFRRDPATVEYLYYVQGGVIRKCSLNTQRSGSDFQITSMGNTKRYMTWDEYDDFRSLEKDVKRQDTEISLIQDVLFAKSTSAIIQASVKKSRTSKKEIKLNQLIERQEDNSSNKLSDALFPKPEQPKKQIMSDSIISSDIDPFEALAKFADNPYLD